ncbi:MAG: efflux RND transporter periplasmic adaptor subunit [Pseudomonadota bacterium]
MRVFSVMLIRIGVTVLPVLAGLVTSASLAAPTPVVVVTAETRELTPVVQVAGTVISRNDTRLAAQVEGQVTWVADVGTPLAVGDVAAQLDDVLIRAVLAEEEAEVAREQANVTFHRLESQRLAKLASDNHAALSRLDESKRDLSIARSELAAAKSRVVQSREKLERTAIKAPFAGVVTERFIQAGEWADTGTAMIRLVDTASLEVRAWVPVKALPYIHENNELQLTVAGQPASGSVRTLVPVGDDQSRLFELRVKLDDDSLPAGQSVRIAIPTADSQSATVIPRDSLVLRRDGASIFRILDDNTAERVKVTTGMAEGDLIEVQGDIQPGDRVVIRGGERLRTGQEVEIYEQVPGE